MLVTKKWFFLTIAEKQQITETAIFGDFSGFGDKKKVGWGDLYFYLFIIVHFWQLLIGSADEIHLAHMEQENIHVKISSDVQPCLEKSFVFKQYFYNFLFFITQLVGLLKII